MSRLVLFCFLLISAGFLRGQENESFIFHASFHSGRVLKINPVFPEQEQPAFIVETGVSARTTGSRDWHKLYGYPEIGIRALYFSFGNRDVLGNGWSLLPYLSFDLARGKRFYFSWDFATSLAYLDKPFDRHDNPANNVIGSHFNNLTVLRLNLGYRVSPHWEMFVSCAYWHFSNANAQVPNLGINVPAAGLGVRYSPDMQEGEPPDRLREKSISAIYPGIRLGLGVTEAKVPDGPRYPVFTASAFLNKSFSRKIRLRVGTEWFIPENIYAFIQNQDAPFDHPRWAATGGVVFAGFEFMFGRIGINGQLGPYLKRPYLMDYFLYTKLGVQCYLFEQQSRERNQFFLGIYVHSHAGEADFAEVGLGYHF